MSNGSNQKDSATSAMRGEPDDGITDRFPMGPLALPSRCRRAPAICRAPGPLRSRGRGIGRSGTRQRSARGRKPRRARDRK